LTYTTLIIVGSPVGINPVFQSLQPPREISADHFRFLLALAPVREALGATPGSDCDFVSSEMTRTTMTR
jgi:hypothetical protein